MMSFDHDEMGRRQVEIARAAAPALLPQEVTTANVVTSPYWGDEVDVLELGFNDKPPYYSDEATAIEHRLCRANGLAYGCPPRHWTWSA